MTSGWKLARKNQDRIRRLLVRRPRLVMRPPHAGSSGKVRSILPAFASCEEWKKKLWLSLRLWLSPRQWDRGFHRRVPAEGLASESLSRMLLAWHCLIRPRKKEVCDESQVDSPGFAHRRDGKAKPENGG